MDNEEVLHPISGKLDDILELLAKISGHLCEIENQWIAMMQERNRVHEANIRIKKAELVEMISRPDIKE